MITLIAAVADNGVIGIDNDLPWYLPEDLQRFKRLTTGNTVVMGRKTYESIYDRIGKPLPRRHNVVLTRQQNLPVPPTVQIIHTPEDVQQLEGDVYIIGGTSVYKLLFPLAEVMEITEVHDKPKGDAHFPKLNWNEWTETKREDHTDFSFVTYKRL
ncbi:MAG: dihydrofolate reductase [Patescibacteria group bacterium]